jgi:hypothetical protein
MGMTYTLQNLPATLQTAIAKLPELPKHYNPIRALPQPDRDKLLDDVLAHYECGVSIYALAEALEVDNATLYRQLLKHRPEEWMEVRSARYHSQVEQAEKDMKEASDPLAVTRAREQLANARWMLERLQRKIYGQDQERQVGQAIQINIGIRRDAQTVENAE